MATYNSEYTSYSNRFKKASLGADFKYDSKKVLGVLSSLRKLKSTKCGNNLQTTIDEKNKKLSEGKAVMDYDTGSSTANVILVNEPIMNVSVTRADILKYPEKVTELLDGLITTIENEYQIMENYVEQSDTAVNINNYRAFLKDHAADIERLKPFLEGGMQGPLKAEDNEILKIYWKVKKYDENLNVNSMANSKLFKKAIQASVDKKNAAAKSTARRASSTVSAGAATTQLRATTTTPEMEELKKELTTPKKEVKVENPVYPGTEKMFENTTTEDTTKQTQKETNQIKTDPISTTKTTPTITSGVTGTVAQGVASTIKSAASSSVVKGVVSGAKDAMDKAGDAVTSIGKGVSGALNSAVTAIKSGATGNGNPLKITRLNRNNVDMQVNKGNAFIPPIAGIATAGAAGLGTKVYMDSAKKRKDNKEEEKSSGNKFFDYDKFDDDTTSYLDNSGEAQSKDDILSNIEQKY